MAQREVRFSITQKLVLASTLVVLVLASGFAAFSIIATRAQYQASASRLREAETAALEVRGLTTARSLADSTASAMLEGDLGIVGDAVKEVVGKDGEILASIVVDPNGQVLANAGAASLRVGDKLEPALLGRLQAINTAGSVVIEQGLSGKKAAAFAAKSALGSRSLGWIYVEVSEERLEKALAAIEHDRDEAIRNGITQALGLGLLGVLIGIGIAVLQSVRLSGPIRALMKVSEEVGQGNLDARAQPTTHDEIGVLCDRFNDMTGRLKDLVASTAEKASLERELQLARGIQMQLIPPREAFKGPGIHYYGYCEPAGSCGGDWWQHYTYEDGSVVLCVGDVTGHGVPSALLTASAKACCDTLMLQAKAPSLEGMLGALDKVIRDAGRGDYVMTLFAMKVAPDGRSVEYANAGHNFPLLLRDGKVQSLVARGTRLGDGGPFVPKTDVLQPGDFLLLYTDGLIECTSPSGEEYGMRRMRKMMIEHAKAGPMEATKTMVDDAYTFYAGNPPNDDITVVACAVGA